MSPPLEFGLDSMTFTQRMEYGRKNITETCYEEVFLRGEPESQQALHNQEMNVNKLCAPDLMQKEWHFLPGNSAPKPITPVWSQENIRQTPTETVYKISNHILQNW